MRTHAKNRSLELIAFFSLYTQQEYFQMSKSSASNGDRDKTTGSEISCGNYVTAYENMALPKYLMQISSQNDLIMEMDVEEELNER